MHVLVCMTERIQPISIPLLISCGQKALLLDYRAKWVLSSGINRPKTNRVWALCSIWVNKTVWASDREFKAGLVSPPHFCTKDPLNHFRSHNSSSSLLFIAQCVDPTLFRYTHTHTKKQAGIFQIKKKLYTIYKLHISYERADQYPRHLNKNNSMALLSFFPSVLVRQDPRPRKEKLTPYYLHYCLTASFIKLDMNRFLCKSFIGALTPEPWHNIHENPVISGKMLLSVCKSNLHLSSLNRIICMDIFCTFIYGLSCCI